MTNTIQQAIAYIQTNGGHYADGECERIVNNAGAFTHAYGLAILSMKASPVPLNPNYAAAPDGVLHYWTNVWGTWGSYGYCDAGHVMFGYQGQLWGDSGAITNHTPSYSRFAGSVSKADLEARKSNLRYAGWTPYHGPETLAGISTASSSSTPLNNTTTEDDDMKWIFSPGVGGNIGYAPGRVVVLTQDQWNERCAALGVPAANAPQDGAETGTILMSLLFAEAGLPYNTFLTPGQEWVRPVPTAAPDFSPVLNAITAAVTAIEAHTQTVTTSAPDLTPVLTQLTAVSDAITNVDATLTKGYTFNVKPTA